MNKYYLLLICMLFSSFVSAALIDNNYGYYSMDDADFSGNTLIDLAGNNNATNSGADSATGHIEEGRLFVAGDTDYMYIPDAAGLDLNVFTLAVWIKRAGTAHPSGNDEYLIDRWGGSSGYQLRLSSGDSKIDWVVVTGTGNCDITSSNAITDTNWHLILADYDGTSCTIYVDNTLKASDTGYGSVTHNNNEITIGNYDSGAAGGDTVFEGTIDEFGIWDDELTTAEKTELYNAGNGINPYSNTNPRVYDVEIALNGTSFNPYLDCNFTPKDDEGDAVNVSITWFKNVSNVNSSVSAYDYTFLNTPEGFVNNTKVGAGRMTGELVNGEWWWCALNITDGTAWNYTNSTPLKIENLVTVASNLSNYTAVNNNFALAITYENFIYGTVSCSAYSNTTEITCNSDTGAGGAAEIDCSFSGDFNASVDITPYCTNGTVKNATTYNISVDNVNPMISYVFSNGTTYYKKTMTGQFNFSDYGNLYRWNVTIDGVSIADDNNVGYSFYSYNLSYNTSSLPAGKHTLTLEAADAHTANKLKEDYNVKYPLLTRNKLTFEYYDDYEVSIEPIDKSIFDSFGTEKLDDRYTFTYFPYDKQKNNYEFKVYSDREIFIVEKPNQKYLKWLVIGDHWLDFYMPSEKTQKIEIKRINAYEVVVTLKDIKNKDSINFHSTGDLNVIEQNLTFYSINATVSHPLAVLEGDEETFTLTMNITDTTYTYNDFNFTFNYNNTNYSVTKTSDTNYIYATLDIVAANVTELTMVNFSWNVTFVDEGESYLNFTQSVDAVNVGDCADNPTWIESLNMIAYREENLSLISMEEYNMSLNMNINVLLGGGQEKKFSFEFRDSNNYSICISPNYTTYNISSRLEYGDGDYTDRKYYLNDYVLSNVSNNINLYHLEEDIVSDIILTVFDRTTGERIKGAYVKILRYYPGYDNASGGAYRTVEIERTDTNGETLGKMILGDVWYKFIVEYPAGSVVLNTDIEKMLTTERMLPVGLSVGNLLRYDEVLSMSGDVDCTASTKTCRFTWSDSQNVVTKGTLKIFRDTGYARKLVYSQTVQSPAATIAYTIPGNITSDKYIAEGWIYTNG